MDYQQAIDGLDDENPEVILDSAIWLIENQDQIQEEEAYIKSCELLYTACVENVECIMYINEKLSKDLIFKAQLYTKILSENQEESIKKYLEEAVFSLINHLVTLKKSNTDMVAQIYSYFMESNNPEIIEKAKALL